MLSVKRKKIKSIRWFLTISTEEAEKLKEKILQERGKYNIEYWFYALCLTNDRKYIKIKYADKRNINTYQERVRDKARWTPAT